MKSEAEEILSFLKQHFPGANKEQLNKAAIELLMGIMEECTNEHLKERHEDSIRANK